jgi:phosphoribosylanthranilate isomerase
MLLKVCGITLPEQMKQLDQDKVADLIGLIFYPNSPRFITEMNYQPKRAKSVGVFVNAGFDEIMDKVSKHQLDYVQLHGEETPQLCEELKSKIKVIKVFSVKEKLDTTLIGLYENNCDYFLFDTYSQAYGGTGKSFSWDILHSYEGNVPFILSGGIGQESIKSIIEFEHPRFAGIDINSLFEILPGVKDLKLIKNFKKQFPHENTSFTG